MKELGWLAVGFAVVVRSSSGCAGDCDPEVQVNSAGVKTKIITCTVEITCDGATQTKEVKFPTSGSPVWDQTECDRMAGVTEYQADCTYHSERENKCIPRETKPDDREPTWIIGVAVSTTTYGVEPDAFEGIGGGAGSN